MFKLKLYDRNGVELHLGDIVKISNSGDFKFFAEVKYLPYEQVITPFGTFSFHSFEKVDSLPENAVKSTEERYNIWYLEDPEKDDQAEDFKRYLIDWRECENNIQKRLWRIELENKNP